MFKPRWYKALLLDHDLKGRSWHPKRLVYLCLPYTGDDEAYIRKAVEIERESDDGSCVVVVPYLLQTGVFGEKYSVSVSPEEAAEMISCCDEFWVVRDLLTKNVLEELYSAVKLGKKICYLSTADEEEEPDE